MLRFILGTSGTGKTAAVYDRISELLGTEGARALVLVPDQSTFETEKALLGLLGAKRALRAEVYGFSSLCRRVSELTADVAHNVLDNGTRAVIMSLALEQLTDKLSLLKTRNPKSVTDLMLNTLSECKSCRVTTDMLRFAAEGVGDETQVLDEVFAAMSPAMDDGDVKPVGDQRVQVDCVVERDGRDVVVMLLLFIGRHQTATAGLDGTLYFSNPF